MPGTFARWVVLSARWRALRRMRLEARGSARRAKTARSFQTPAIPPKPRDLSGPQRSRQNPATLMKLGELTRADRALRTP